MGGDWEGRGPPPGRGRAHNGPRRFSLQFLLFTFRRLSPGRGGSHRLGTKDPRLPRPHGPCLSAALLLRASTSPQDGSRAARVCRHRRRRAPCVQGEEGVAPGRGSRWCRPGLPEPPAPGRPAPLVSDSRWMGSGVGRASGLLSSFTVPGFRVSWKSNPLSVLSKARGHWLLPRPHGQPSLLSLGTRRCPTHT